MDRKGFCECVRQSLSPRHEVHFPPEFEGKRVSSKKAVEGCDVLLADVSLPSTGVGIELGYAEFLGKQVILLKESDKPLQASVAMLSKPCIDYFDFQDLSEKLKLI
jgi:nucleoside 2-deoxyribosyltransferase